MESLLSGNLLVDKTEYVGETYSGSHSLDEWKEIVEKELENVTEGKIKNG